MQIKISVQILDDNNAVLTNINLPSIKTGEHLTNLITGVENILRPFVQAVEIPAEPQQ